MRHSLLLVLGLLTALLAVAPDAFATRTVIFDPGAGTQAVAPPTAQCAGDSPCQVFNLGSSYLNTWIPCTTQGLPSGLAQYSSCLWYQNQSGSPAAVFNFAMTVGAGDEGQALACDVSPEGIATWSCPGSLPQAVGGLFTLTFFANPAIANTDNFILAINDEFESNPGSPSVVASVPEPGVLGLFGLGLIAIVGAYGWKRRRDGAAGRA